MEYNNSLRNTPDGFTAKTQGRVFSPSASLVVWYHFSSKHDSFEQGSKNNGKGKGGPFFLFNVLLI